MSVYKYCVNISDENALEGLSMLSAGHAGVWKQSAKRHAYGKNKSAPIFFSSEQVEKEPTDFFVIKCRALLSYLPDRPVWQDSHKLEMIYRLLSSEIRERLPRTDSNSFDVLIKKERSLSEMSGK